VAVWVCRQLHTASGAHFTWGISASTRSVGRTASHESAGKRHPDGTPQGHNLAEACAFRSTKGAPRTKDTYLFAPVPPPPGTPGSPDGEGPTRPYRRGPLPLHLDVSWHCSPTVLSMTILAMTTLAPDTSSSDTIQLARRLQPRIEDLGCEVSIAPGAA
jgi:hypothetical protein